MGAEPLYLALLDTPIRRGQSSSLYFKMAERLNCGQNQVIICNKVLIRDKVGGILTFFSELGFRFPQFPFIAHSRGWSAEILKVEFTHEQVARGDARPITWHKRRVR